MFANSAIDSFCVWPFKGYHYIGFERIIQSINLIFSYCNRSIDPILCCLFTEKPKYKGPPPPPNRFGIMPGYRWDGVNRSNGFEKQIFAKQAEKKAFEKMKYKWSTEDM